MAKVYITKVLKRLPIKLAIDKDKLLFLNKTRAKEAPNNAPDEVPVRYGSAMGFLNIACSPQPVKARLEPTNIAKIILGIHKLRTIN